MSGVDAAGGPIKSLDTNYFLSRQTLIASSRRGMAIWRERLFVWMVQKAEGPMEFFKLPSNREVELGSQIEIQRAQSAKRAMTATMAHI